MSEVPPSHLHPYQIWREYNEMASVAVGLVERTVTPDILSRQLGSLA
jgi:hypothetical protein